MLNFKVWRNILVFPFPSNLLRSISVLFWLLESVSKKEWQYQTIREAAMNQLATTKMLIWTSVYLIFLKWARKFHHHHSEYERLTVFGVVAVVVVISGKRVLLIRPAIKLETGSESPFLNWTCSRILSPVSDQQNILGFTQKLSMCNDKKCGGDCYHCTNSQFHRNNVCNPATYFVCRADLGAC